MFVRFYVQLWYLLLLVVKLGHTSYVSHPNIDFDSLDKLIIAGSYNGISIYKDTDQLTQIPQKTSSIISLSNDTLKLLGTSDINGIIYDSCLLSGSIYFGGNFTTINGATVNHIASYNLNTNELKLLKNGLDGPVYTLYCDTENKQVYVGGSFIAPIDTSMTNYTNSLSQFGGGIALWKNNAWTGLPWKGFNGPVYTIVQRNSTKTLFFGGKFDTTTDGQTFHAPASQPIALSATGVTATSTATGSADPSTIICAGESNANPWYLADNTNGTWQVTFTEYSVNPSLIRLVNSKLTGHQTKGFSIRSLTDSVVYEFTYLDPATNTTKTCSTNCTLSNDPNVTFQDFRITNLSLTSGIAIDINSWYGTSGGLASVQVFQSEIFTYAVNADNTNVCTTTSSGLPKVTTSGTWTNASTYLSASVSSSSDPSVTFYPNLVESGIYEVLLYSPVCDTCTDRTDVDLVFQATSTSKANVTASQTVTGGLSVYTGYFEVSSTFNPTVKLALASNVTVSSSKPVSIYAYAVQFVKVASSDVLQSIAQYNTTQTNITMNTIPWGPLNENVPYKASVYSMSMMGNDIYIGGNFSSTDSSNAKYTYIVKYDAGTNKMQALQGSGVNGVVNTIATTSTEVYVGGSFTGLSDANTTVSYLNNVARYSAQTSTWNSLVGGVDAPVKALNWLQDQQTILVSGQYTRLLQTNSISSPQKVPGNAYWNTASQQFQSSTSLPYLSGTVNSAISYNSNLYFAGDIKSAQRYQASGLSYVSTIDALSLYSGYSPSTESTALVSAGSLNTSKENEISIFGGQFSLSDGIQNLAIYNNNTWSGFTDASWQGTVSTMAIYGDTLLVGGSFTGSSFSGLAIFSISNKSLSSAPEVKTSSLGTARVNIIRAIPQQNLMVVGGSFSAIGSIACTSICSLNTQTSQWSALGTGVDGEIMDVQYINEKLVVSGNLTLNNSPLLIAEYDFGSSKWGPLGTADLPGPSQIMSYDNITQSVYISGTFNSTSYLRKWTGEQFVSLNQDLGPGSIISNLAMLPVTGNTTDASSKQNVLLASGFINLGTCNVSAAFYDDTDGWIPYLVASDVEGTPSTSLLSSLFFMNQHYFTTQKPKSYLPTPLVILVSIAASLGIVFLIVLGAMCIVYVKKKRDRKINPENNPATYYGKPPRSPEALLALLKETSPDNANDEGLEKSGHEQFYNMAASISTDHLQEQNLTPYTAVGAATAVRNAPHPPAHTYQPNNNYQNMFNTPSPTSNVNVGTNVAAAAAFAPIVSNTARPESYARPYSEIQRDSNTSSFYNNEYNNAREMSEVPRSYSPFNPFRNPEIGVAVSENGSKNNLVGAAIAGGVAGAVIANENKQQQQQQQQQRGVVNYSNIPPPNTSNLTVDKPEGVRWTTAPAANIGSAIVKPISMVGNSDESNVIDPMNDTSNEVRWTTAPVPTVSSAVVKPVSMIDPEQNLLNAPNTDQSSEMRWTTAPNSQNAMDTAVIMPVPVIVTQDSNEKSMHQDMNMNASTTTLDTLPPSSNVRWTNYNADDAIAQFKVDPVTRDSALNSYYGLPNSNTGSQGFSSDPDFAKFTSSTDQVDNDKNQYHASLSSFAWPEIDEYGKAHTLEAAGAAGAAAAAAFAKKDKQDESHKKNDSIVSQDDNKINTKVFRLSDAGSLAPIETQGFDIDREGGLSPDSAVRWKTAKVGSPIETAYAPNILEPATATVTTRTEMENPFDTYYNKTQEPVGRKSETIDEVIASRDLNALSFMIDEEEPLPTLQKKESNPEKDTPIPHRTATPSGIGALDGRASSKRMVEKYFSSRKSVFDDKRSKYKSDFKSIMETALENNAKTPVATEDKPHLYYAKFDFDSREHGELGFVKNDPIIVVDNSDDIWWMGYKADKSDGSYIQGVFPSNYVEIAVSLR